MIVSIYGYSLSMLLCFYNQIVAINWKICKYRSIVANIALIVSFMSTLLTFFDKSEWQNNWK